MKCIGQNTIMAAVVDAGDRSSAFAGLVKIAAFPFLRVIRNEV